MDTIDVFLIFILCVCVWRYAQSRYCPECYPDMDPF